MNLIRARSWGRTIPAVGASLDRGHPLAQGLGAAWLANAEPLVDLVGTNTLRRHSADTKSVNSRGGLFTPASGGTAVGFTSAAATSMVKPFSVGMSFSWYGMIVGTGDSGADVAVLTYDNASSSPFLVFGYDRSGGTGFRLLGNAAGSLFTADIETPALLTPLTYTCVWRFGAAPKVYRNGVLVLTDSTRATPTTTSTSLLRFGGGASAASRGSNAVLYAAQVWNRPLLFDEVRWLAAEPYVFIAPPGPKILYIALGAPVATVIGTVAVALAPFASSAAAGTGPSGTAAQTLGSFTPAATGGSGSAGTVAVTLAPFTSNAAGSTVTGTSATSLDSFAPAASGGTGATGSGAPGLGSFVATATGGVGPSGSSATTLAPFVSAGDGSSVVGTVDQTLAPATSAASGATGPAGTVAALLDPFTSSGSGATGSTGTIAATLGAFVSTGAGSSITGTVAAILAPFICAATGEVVIGFPACVALAGSDPFAVTLEQTDPYGVALAGSDPFAVTLSSVEC